MRRIVITGPQPVDMLDRVGPLEVFKFAPEYEVAVASPEGTTELQLNHGFKISDAVPFTKLPAQIDTLVVAGGPGRSEEHTSELQSPCNLVCRLLLEKKKKTKSYDLKGQ